MTRGVRERDMAQLVIDGMRRWVRERERERVSGFIYDDIKITKEWQGMINYNEIIIER